MTHGIRRVITTHDAAGKAVIASDGPAPNVRRREASGIISTLLWVLDQVPARYADGKDFVVGGLLARAGTTAPAPSVEEVP